MATLAELKTVLSFEDVCDLADLIRANDYNDWLAQKQAAERYKNG